MAVVDDVVANMLMMAVTCTYLLSLRLREDKKGKNLGGWGKKDLGYFRNCKRVRDAFVIIHYPKGHKCNLNFILCV